MMAKSIIALVASFMLFSTAFSQNDFKSEEELKEQALKLFEERKLVEASPLFAQLLSLYPQDPNYNYKYGATLLEASADREKPLKYLKFAISKSSQVEPLAYYFLGKAHHLNYNFADAVKYYSRFKQKAGKELIDEFKVERQIEMAKNGNQLLSKLNEVQVLDKQTISRKDFFRIYELEGIDGKVIVKPEEFMTKYDQKVGEKSVIYLPTNASEVYFSSYGKKGENGRDIFKTVKLGNRSWSEPVNLGSSINTPYDENYPFIHPDGRTLYFASKGHSSMGGYDLFVSVFDQSTGQWKAPVNLDFAFSSVDDDILFITDKNKVLAYFASSRANEADNVTVYKVMVEKAPAELSVIKGKFIAENNPDLKKAKITVIDSKSQETIGIYDTDKDGNYQIEIASNGGLYRFNVETTADDPIHTGEVEIPHQDVFEVLGQELRLVGQGEAQQLVIKNIFDGTMAQSSSGGPSISSTTLRQKALLDINFSEEALAELNSRQAAEQSSVAENAQARSQDRTTTSSTSGTEEQLADNGSSNQDANNSNQSGGNNANQSSSSNGGLNPSTSVPIVAGGAVAGAAAVDQQKEQNLNKRVSDLENSMDSKSAELNAQTAYTYQKAIDLKAQADQAYADAGINPSEKSKLTSDQASSNEDEGLSESGELSSSSSDAADASSTIANDESNVSDQTIDPKTAEARELASRAAIRAALAQKLEARSNAIDGVKNDLSSQKSGIESSIQEADYQNAERSISTYESQSNSISSASDYLQDYQELLSKAIATESSTLEEEKGKLGGLQAESSRIDSSITALENQIAESNESGTTDEAVQSQLDELKLDREDLQFQLRNTSIKVAEKETELAALNLEKEEVAAVSTEIAQVSSSSAEQNMPSTTDREELITDLKTYRDNDQLAYSAASAENKDYLSPSQLYVGGEFISSGISEMADAGGSTTSSSSSSRGAVSLDGAEMKSVASLDQEYLADMNQAESLPDQDLINARKIELYDQWISELDQQAELRRTNLTKINDQSERETVQDEINQISREIVSKQSEQQQLRSAIAAESGGIAAANTTSTSDPVSSNNRNAVDGSTGSTPTSVLPAQSQDAGSSRTDELIAALEPSNIEDVEANSPYPQGLDAFKFDKGYTYSSSDASPALKSVKTSLYQAKEFNTKADAARAAAYTLPTVEERRQAFEDVNEYDKASERLQLQAMEDVANVNQQEYYKNASILNNLNEYDDSEIESNSLDIAILLQDEAETYFNNAQVIRSESEAATSANNKRVKLQKAYDMEMLALNKQRQALESLKLVDTEAELAASTSTAPSYRNAQIQTITDPDILAIEDAAVAKQEADAIIVNAEAIEADAERLRKSAEVEDIGPTRDSLMSLYEAKQDSANQLRAKAAVYYEREEQINTGFEAVPADVGVLKPALIFTQSYELDTVNVDDERKNVVLESKEYQTFSALAKDNQQLRMAARVEYDKAVELRKKQFQLDKEAQVILASAAETDDASEKERRIKQAQVIQLKADKIDDSIDSLNKIIRVKNYLVASSEDKMRGSIASLSAVQQAEIIYLVNQEVDITSTDLDYSDYAAQTEISSASTNSQLADGGARPVSSNTSSSNIIDGNDGGATPSTSNNTSSSTGNQGELNLSPPIPVSTRKSPSANDGGTEAANERSTEEVLDDGTVNPEKIIRSAPRRPASLANIDRMPRTVDEPIFIKLGLNESAYDESKPIPSLVELPDGLVYKVQVGAFRNPIPQDLFKGFAPLTSEPGPNGITRYTAGLFNNEREAVGARDEIRNFGYKDAFVVVFRNGERISIRSARSNAGALAQSSSSATNDQSRTSSTPSGTTPSSNTNTVPSRTADLGEDVKNAATIDELFFTVQIGVYSKKVKEGTFAGLEDVNALELPTGLIRYNSGIFQSLEQAENHKNNISSNIADAFVVVYYNGRRISVNEAARILNQN